MLTHDQIWQSIDRLAHAHGYSPSGLARKAGLDPTTFNKSKRVSADGKPRWPSTESISKILSVTGAGMAEFLSLGDQQKSPASLHPGDKVAVHTKDGDTVTGKLVEEDDERIILSSSGGKKEFSRDDIEWIAVIIG